MGREDGGALMVQTEIIKPDDSLLPLRTSVRTERLGQLLTFPSNPRGTPCES